MSEDKSSYLIELGKHIRSERLKKNKSSEALAYEIGISKGNLSEIERGMRDVRIFTLKLIAEGLDTTLAKLLKDL